MALIGPWSDERVRSVLPHRHEMLLCPAAIVGDSHVARATIRVPPDGWQAGMDCPHLYLLEALGQLAGIALASHREEDAAGPVEGYLAEIPEARFGGEPRPGDEVRLEVAPDISFGSLHRFRVTARRGDVTFVEGAITVATG